MHTHLHRVMPDAMWLRGVDGELSTIDLVHPTDEHVAELARTV